MRLWVIICLVFFICSSALAEYRVFTLHIINKKTNLTRQVETTLDPEQFIGFYPLKNDESISYIETWKCLGRTDFFKSHCNNPRLEISSESKPPNTQDQGLGDMSPKSPELLN